MLRIDDGQSRWRVSIAGFADARSTTLPRFNAAVVNEPTGEEVGPLEPAGTYSTLNRRPTRSTVLVSDFGHDVRPDLHRFGGCDRLLRDVCGSSLERKQRAVLVLVPRQHEVNALQDEGAGTALSGDIDAISYSAIRSAVRQVLTTQGKPYTGFSNATTPGKEPVLDFTGTID